jgi:hypothetical protein
VCVCVCVCFLSLILFTKYLTTHCHPHAVLRCIALRCVACVVLRCVAGKCYGDTSTTWVMHKMADHVSGRFLCFDKAENDTCVQNPTGAYYSSSCKPAHPTSAAHAIRLSLFLTVSASVGALAFALASALALSTRAWPASAFSDCHFVLCSCMCVCVCVCVCVCACDDDDDNDNIINTFLSGVLPRNRAHVHSPPLPLQSHTPP